MVDTFFERVRRDPLVHQDAVFVLTGLGADGYQSDREAIAETAKPERPRVNRSLTLTM
jgi:hypothetical protein